MEILSSAAKAITLRKVEIETTEGFIYFNKKDILFIESDYGKTRIITENQVYSTKTTLMALKEKLNDRPFALTHRCYIVNLQHVTKCQERTVYLTGARAVPLSRNYRKAFSQSMTNYLRGAVI